MGLACRFAVADYVGEVSWQLSPLVEVGIGGVPLGVVAVEALLVGLVVAEVDDELVGVDGEVTVLRRVRRVERGVGAAVDGVVVRHAAVELNAAKEKSRAVFNSLNNRNRPTHLSLKVPNIEFDLDVTVDCVQGQTVTSKSNLM